MRWRLAWFPLFLTIHGACGPAATGGTPSGDTGSGAERGLPILVDGSFREWRGLAPAAAGDLGRLWLAHDERFLFLSFDLGAEINLREGTDLELYLDTDGNPATGAVAPAMGAELVWRFGDQSGLVARGETTTEVGHAAIGLVTAPTVASSRFEVALDRKGVEQAAKDGTDLDRVALEGRVGDPPSSGSWRVTLATSGDRLPAAGPGVRYAFDGPPPLRPPSAPDLGEKQPGALRLLTYNVERDGLFDPRHRGAFARILAAVAPDLIAFQELYEHDAEAARRAVAAVLGGEWHAAKAGLDLVVVSRGPILRSQCITYCSEYGSTGAFLIDAGNTLDRRLLLIAVHPPCCTGGDPPMEVQRQYVVDATMAYLRDARSPGVALEVEADTPILIAGDLNLVGDRQPLDTLLTGEIVHRELGASAAPDWDGSPLADLRPLHTDLPMVFTWFRDSRRSFSPGRLDFIAYSDSVLRATKSYVLFTLAMSDETLAANGLERRDTCVSDHLPVVGDFVPAARTELRSRPADSPPSRDAPGAAE